MILVFLIVFILLGFEKPTVEKINGYTLRYRYKWGLPFKKKKTIVIKDVSLIGADTVTHIFNYMSDKSYQFINGKYSQTLGLYDVV